MESDGGGIQNEFFNRVRKERTPLMVSLTDGSQLVGRLRAFDKFTILLETKHGDQIVFKHAIATVETAPPGAAEGTGGGKR
jgi:host factor-I protein